jgi:hypothetical protein
MFCEAVEFGSIDLEQNEVPAEWHDNPVRWIVGQLWNCSDVMPRDVCEALDLSQGASYASGARALREMSFPDDRVVEFGLIPPTDPIPSPSNRSTRWHKDIRTSLDEWHARNDKEIST